MSEKPNWMKADEAAADAKKELRALAVEGLIALKRLIMVPPRTSDEKQAAEDLAAIIERGVELANQA